MNNSIVFFCGSAKHLEKRTCQELGIQPGKIDLGCFSDGEHHVQILENVRGKKVFVVGVTTPPFDNFLEMSLIVDAAKRASAAQIVIVPAYLGYNRQDRKDKPRVPISADVVCDFLGKSAHKVVLFDLHSEVTAAFFRNSTVDVLFTSWLAVPFIKEQLGEEISNLVVVSPDAGGAKRAQKYSKLLGLGGSYAMISKGERPADNQIGNDLKVVGEVRGKDIIIVDDILDTCGTIVKAAMALKQQGAQRVFIYAPFALLSGNALDKLQVFHEVITQVFTTNVIYHKPQDLQGKDVNITIIPFEPFLAQVIKRMAREESLSELFI